MLAGIDVGLAKYLRTVIHDGFELNIGRGCRENMPTRGQDLRRLLDSDGKVTGHGGERRQKQVAEVVPFQIACAGEAKLKQLGKKVLVFRERNQAVANVA